MAAIQQEDLLNYLQQSCNNNENSNTNDRSVFTHLVDLLTVLARDRPKNALNSLEELSVLLKKQQYNSQTYNEIDDMYSGLNDETRQLIQNKLELTENLIRTSREAPQLRVDTDEDDNDDIEQDDIEYGDIPDIMNQASLLKWAGINLSEEEWFKLLLSIRQLAGSHDSNIATTRFFGKIFGTEKDYYVCETTLREYPDNENLEENSKIETSGTGLNTYVYFVCNELGDEWTQLPDVKPEQIKKARYMRRFFTGDLNRDVLGFPHFPWNEASYLRAQIARISGSTIVAPSGVYSVDEESEPPTIIVDEEFEGHNVNELNNADGWVFTRSYVLKQGRSQPWEAPENEDEDDDEDDDVSNNGKNDNKENEDDNEEPKPLLSNLNCEDEDGNDLKTWSFRYEPSKNDFPHAVAISQSLQWPGAIAVANKQTFVNVYIGWGQKQLNKAYSPPVPPCVQKEWKKDVEDIDEDSENSDDDEERVVKAPVYPQECVEQVDLTEDPNPPEPEEEEEQQQSEEEESEEEESEEESD